MTLAKAKIDAQRLLLNTRGPAVFISLFTVFAKLLFLAAVSLSTYSLTVLPGFTRISENIYLKIACILLFSLAILFSMMLYALVDFSEKRWFYQNACTPQRTADFFSPPRMRHIFKISFLFWLRQLLRIGLFCLYFAPFLLGTGGLYYALRTTDMPVASLYIVSGALVCMLPLCVYFGFTAVQRFAFCDGLLAVNPNYGTVEVLRISRTLAKEFGFAYARFKLRFALWQAACVLVFPLFYVLPYYRQSVAYAVKIAIDENHLSTEVQKPIVFMLSAKATA